MTLRGSHRVHAECLLYGQPQTNGEKSDSAPSALLALFKEMPGRGGAEARAAGYHSTTLGENTTSISVPEPAPVLM